MTSNFHRRLEGCLAGGGKLLDLPEKLGACRTFRQGGGAVGGRLLPKTHRTIEQPDNPYVSLFKYED